MKTFFFITLLAIFTASCQKEKPQINTCEIGYEGTNCDSLIIAKYLNTYFAHDDSPIRGTSEYIVQIVPYEGKIDQCYINQLSCGQNCIPHNLVAKLLPNNQFQLLSVQAFPYTFDGVENGNYNPQTGTINFKYRISQANGTTEIVNTQLISQ